MTVEREEVINIAERGNTLAVEAAQTLLESVSLPQRQVVQLGQTILHTIEANQQASRDLTRQLVRQTLEGQILWWQLLQQPIKAAIEVYAQAAQAAPGASDRNRTAAGDQARETTTAAAGR